MEHSKYYSMESILSIVDQLTFPNKDLIADQIKGLFETHWKIELHNIGKHSFSIYSVLPTIIVGNTVSVHFVLQLFLNYPSSSPRVFMFSYGEFIPNAELDYIHKDGDYFYIDIPYIRDWNMDNTLKELSTVLYDLFQKEPPIKSIIPIINYMDVEILQKIGEGCDGTVYKCKYKNNIYALKKYHASLLYDNNEIEETNRNVETTGTADSQSNTHIPMLTPSTQSNQGDRSELYRKQIRMRREISIHAYMNNPYIVKIYGICEEGHSTCVLLEKCKHTLLHMLIGKKYILNINLIHSWIMNIIGAINYIHSQNILHRDIKADNILIDSNNIAKLCDFGFARTYNPNSVSSILGTPTHVAPEVLSGRSYSKKVDIYSFGVLLIEMFTRFDMESYLRQFPTNNELFVDLTHYMDNCILKIVKLCLAQDPSERPSMSSIQRYFEKINWAQVKYYRTTI